MRLPVAALTVATGLGLGCAQAPPPQGRPTVETPVTVTLEALEADSVAEVHIDLLLASESSLVEPDTFYAPGALVLADGELRSSVPRLAGVGLGGTIQLISSRVSTSGSFVWAIIEYRWLPMFESDAVRFGVATVVVGRAQDGSWRVMHMHSSSPHILPERERPEPPDTTGSPGQGGS